MAIGGALLVFGAVMPFALMMQWVRSTLLLNFASAGATLAGSVGGLYGLFEYVQRKKKQQ